jgi:hypothetical protein
MVHIRFSMGFQGSKMVPKEHREAIRASGQTAVTRVTAK